MPSHLTSVVLLLKEKKRFFFCFCICFFYCINVLPASVYVDHICAWYPWRSEGIGSLWMGVTVVSHHAPAGGPSLLWDRFSCNPDYAMEECSICRYTCMPEEGISSHYKWLWALLSSHLCSLTLSILHPSAFTSWVLGLQVCLTSSGFAQSLSASEWLQCSIQLTLQLGF